MAFQYATQVPYGTKTGNQYYVQTSPTGGAWSSTPATPKPATQQVLGAGTKAGGTGSAGLPSGVQNMGAQQPTQASDLPDINSIYNPQIDYLNGLAGQLGQTKNDQLGQIGTQYTGKQKTIGDQSAQLKGQLTQNQTQFDQQLQSAYAQAAKDYDSMSQRNIAMYGGQSSAGGAMNDILGQAYLGARNGLANQGLQGNQAFSQEGLGITSWEDTQNNNLDQWKSEAENQIISVFQQGINQINQDKATTESAKQQAKMELLKQVVDHRQALADYDTQLRQQAAVAQQMQGYQGSAYDTSGFQGTLSNLNSAIPQQIAAMNSMASAAGYSPQAAQNFTYQYGLPNQGKSQEDAYSQIIGQ